VSKPTEPEVSLRRKTCKRNRTQKQHHKMKVSEERGILHQTQEEPW